MSDNMAKVAGEIAGQVALVTGGSRGLGRVIARTLAAAGVAVAVTARDAKNLQTTLEQIEAAGGRGLAVVTDVSEPGLVNGMVNRVQNVLGPIDLLVNNAGVSGPFGPSWTVDEDDWWRCMAINVHGPFLCTQAVLPGMLERGQGCVINMASGAGTSAWPHLSAYAVSKAALIRLSENTAQEVQGRGVAIFAIGPGLVETDMTNELMQSDLMRELGADRIRPMFEQGRDVPPELCAQLVCRLAGGAFDGLNGRYIHVHHDLDKLLREQATIVEKNLQTLRMTELDS